MTISNALLTYVVRTKVPGGRWVGVGVGVLVGLGVDEITAPVSAPLVIQAFVVAATVVLDRFLRGAVRPVVGVMATIAMISSLLAGVACFASLVPGWVTVLMICAAVFGWLLSVSIGSSLGNTWFTLGLNGPLALFDPRVRLVRVAGGWCASRRRPAGLINRTHGRTDVGARGMGRLQSCPCRGAHGLDCRPGPDSCPCTARIGAGGGCGVEAWDSLVLSGVGAAAALTTSRLVPFV